MNRRATLAILQPYVPRYREEFFNRLFVRLGDHDIDCHVYSALNKQQISRGDTAQPGWLRRYPERRFQVGSRSLSLGGGRSVWQGMDAVVLGLMGSSLDSYRAVIDRQLHGLRVGFWGHIRPYVAKGNAVDLFLEKELMKRSDHLFAYTQGGAEFAVAHGADGERVTTVMNSIDTNKLQIEREKLRSHPEQVERFSRRLGLVGSRTFSYIGALDGPKRIQFLANALDILWSRAPDVKVLLAGHGPDEHLLSAGVERGQIVKLGYADAAMQALMTASSTALLMPGRIGLIAVEALVLAKPIITTDWAFHSAEKEYLEEGISMFTSPNDPASYANLLERVINQGSIVHSSSQQWLHPTIEDMVNRFSSGVLSMLEAR